MGEPTVLTSTNRVTLFTHDDIKNAVGVLDQTGSANSSEWMVPERTLLGGGGFGKVYAIRLHIDGEESDAVVKRLKDGDEKRVGRRKMSESDASEQDSSQLVLPPELAAALQVAQDVRGCPYVLQLLGFVRPPAC
jgi:hypothetical protein